MKKKLFVIMAIVGVSSMIFAGCGDEKNKDKEMSSEEIMASIKQEMYEEDREAVSSIQDAIKDYMDEASTNELSGEAKEVYNDHLKDSLEGKVSDENLQDMLDILNGSEEETSEQN